MFASLSASSDRIDDTAGITVVPGYPAALTIAGRSSATRSGMHNSRPACLVGTRSGHCSKSITPVRGSCSRRGAPRNASGRRHSRPKPSSAITSAIPVRFSVIPSRVSTRAISSIECPAERSSTIRACARSFAGARLGPGRAETKNSRRPARKSRTIEFSVSTVYPNACATSPAGRRSNRYARSAS